MLLELDNVSVSYGPVRAVEDVSLGIEAGSIVTLLGANGAGKSSLLAAISGITPLQSGRISFDASDLRRFGPNRIVQAGIALAPEGRRIFGEMTVLENLEMGGYTVRDRGRLREGIESGFHYFPVLAERRDQLAATLSGGEQQMLAVARALMSSPRLLMLDEPSLGLAPRLVDQIFDIIRQINRERGVTVFLVEQNANEALLHADYGYVLENGKVTLSGSAEDLREDPRVVEAYLGG